MSSARKRSAIKKANNETDFLKQKLVLAEHHLSVMETFAKIAAMKHDEKQIEVYELMLKYCPEKMTEQDHINYTTGKQKLEEYKNPSKTEPIPQLIFAEEKYHEASIMDTVTNQ